MNEETRRSACDAGRPGVRRAALTTRTLAVALLAAATAPAAGAQQDPGEWYAAPFVVERGGPRDAGRVLRAVDATAGDRWARKVSLMDRFVVRVPAGGSAAVGAAFLVYSRGPALAQGQVVRPTGIVVVERAAPGEAVLGRLVRQYGVVEPGQGLVPLVQPPASGTSRSGVGDARVAWVATGALLPSLQDYVVLDAGANGASPGDLFTLVSPPEWLPDGTVLGESTIAIARVVRVTPQGVSAIVVDHDRPGIRAGLTARGTASRR